MRYTILIIILFLFSPVLLPAQTKKDYENKSDDYMDKADYKNALLQIEQALQFDSLDIGNLLRKGNCLWKLKEIKGAYNTFTAIIHIDPKYTPAYNERGLLLGSLQEFEASLKDFDYALGLEKADTMKIMLLVNRAATKIGFRDFQGAYTDLYAAYQYDTLSIGTLNNLAAVCDEVGKGDQTLKYLFKILTIDSTFIGAWGNIGFKYQEMGDYKKAIWYFDKVLELDPNEPLGYNNRSYNKLKLKDYKGALEDVEKSIQLYPENSYAYRNRALINIELKLTGKVCSDLDKALDLGFTVQYGEEVSKLKFKYCNQKTQ